MVRTSSRDNIAFSFPALAAHKGIKKELGINVNPL